MHPDPDGVVTAIRDARDRVVAETGRWIASNIHLGHGVYTMGHDHVGTVEVMAHAMTQTLADVAGRPLEELRVLDLGCGEGGYAIELGLHGATVVGIDARNANLAKGRFAAAALGLDNVTFVQADVRDVSSETMGRFDVVLCLGILYHLEAEDAVRLVQQCYDLAERVVLIRTAVGLSADFDAVVAGHRYRGRRYREDTGMKHASVGNSASILPTRASLLNLLADVGFTSVVELRNPAVPGLDTFLDSVSLAAFRGRPTPFRSLPGVDEGLGRLRRRERRGPGWIWAVAHPQQGIYWRARERLFGTVTNVVWRSHRPIEEWHRQGSG